MNRCTASGAEIRSSRNLVGKCDFCGAQLKLTPNPIKSRGFAKVPEHSQGENQMLQGWHSKPAARVVIRGCTNEPSLSSMGFL